MPALYQRDLESSLTAIKDGLRIPLFGGDPLKKLVSTLISRSTALRHENKAQVRSLRLCEVSLKQLAELMGALALAEGDERVSIAGFRAADGETLVGEAIPYSFDEWLQRVSLW